MQPSDFTDPKAINPRSGGYVLPRSNYAANPGRGANPAADVIRDKLAKIYANEPDAFAEEQVAAAEPPKERSKHQKFMQELNSSGKDLAQIQIEWHNYYQNLPDDEKHQVWQEFYASSQNDTAFGAAQAQNLTPAERLVQLRNERVTSERAHPPAPAVTQTAAVEGPGGAVVGQGEPETIEQPKRRRAAPSGRPKKHRRARRKPKNPHVQSLLFGLGMGGLAVIIFLFSFFNEVVIAPFIQPSRAAADTPLIVTADSIAPNATPEVIIPKINVQIPADYSQTSTNEADIENALESGVVHYPTTSLPGQNGNAAFFGHSSNNIFNPGKYKFAFVLLHELVPGDTFYLTKDGKVYAYKVFSKNVVPPTQVSVLDPVAGHQATATLITCDPPGTSLNRLIIVGDQVSPSVSGNGTGAPAAAGTTTTDTSASPQLAGNGPTLWGRFVGRGPGKAIVGGLAAIIVVFIARRVSRGRRR